MIFAVATVAYRDHKITETFLRRMYTNRNIKQQQKSNENRETCKQIHELCEELPSTLYDANILLHSPYTKLSYKTILKLCDNSTAPIV